jgi:hypothetical protein
MTMGPEPMTRIFRIEVSLGMVVKMIRETPLGG